MTDFGPSSRTSHPLHGFTGVELPAAAFSGVRTRRLLAFVLDFIAVSILAAVLWSVVVALSLGLLFFVLPSLWPLVAFFYNGTTVSGPRMATPGMRLLDLEIRASDGSPVTFLTAGVHAVLLYASWLVPPVFLVCLITPDKRCLHDILAAVIVVRRPF